MVRGNPWMLSGSGRLLNWWPVVLCLAACSGSLAIGQIPDLDGLSEDEQKQVEIASRFLGVLEGNPRRGTALDRIYGHHVEFGTLDDFLQSLRDRVKNAPDDGTGWMLLGLFEAHRGEDAEAIEALTKAEELRPDDALASYYLGQSLLLLGQPERAVEAFERAIERQPQRPDLLEIFQQLGRIHQRAQRTEQSLRTWERLESLFPEDPRVQEQIAVVLVEEGQYEMALPRYEKLTTLVRDDYRRTMFRIQAAELKIRLNRREEGLADFESLLGDLNPDSWLHRDVRRRIEDVFLRSGDQDGLTDYYEKWIVAHPEDVDAMARLARFLAASARVPEATKWMEKALALAPKRTELRKAFIDQLVDDQRYFEALEQYALLVESAPGNPDFLRAWGRLVSKNPELDPDRQRAETGRIWRRILAARPDDAVTTAQVADLFRQADMNNEALELYQKAVEQAPREPQYREYLGEFYHILKRPDEARATWNTIAAGDRHTAVNVARLAEICHSFGYLEEAVSHIAEACRLEAKDFPLHLKAAEYHARAGKHDEALQFVAVAEALAASAEERDAVVVQRIDILRASRRLDDEIKLLADQVREDEGSTAEQWLLLARYYEADGRWAEATAAVDRSLEIEAASIPALTTAARIAERSGDYGRAAGIYRQLAAGDRRSRSEYLMNVARLEAELGRADEALRAARELIVAAPGNTDNHEFYAGLCSRLGRFDEGIDILRKAVRINPSEPHLIMALGSALSSQFRTDEAIEVYWRAFEKTDDLDDRTSLTTNLTNLYLQMNQFDKLLERLERERREEDQRREMTICLAQAHHAAGDYGSARQELESLLHENTRDTNLLQQLSKLCEEGADLNAAVEYQRQLVAIAPGHETEYRLATLLQSRGDGDEAGEILLNLMQREEDPLRRMRNIDMLLRQGAHENVIALIEPLLSEQRDAWELLYREGVAWASLDKVEEARDRFERLLSLPNPHDELGIVATDRFQQAQARARSNNLLGTPSQTPTRPSPFSRLSRAAQIRRETGLEPDRDYYGSSGGLPPIWTPDAFGDARMAAYAWLLSFDEQTASEEGVTPEQPSALQTHLEELAAAAAKPDTEDDTLYDWLYVEQLRGNLDSVFDVARRLAKEGGREERHFFLASLSIRGVNASTTQAPNPSHDGPPKREPLSEEDIELMLECYKELTKDAEDQSHASPFAGQVAYSTSGQAYVQVGGGWVPVSGRVSGGVYLGSIVEELELAGRAEQASQLVQQQLDVVETSSALMAAMALMLERKELNRLDTCFPQWLELARAEIAETPAVAAGGPSRLAGRMSDPLQAASHVLMNWMAQLGPDEEHAKILALLDEVLALNAEVARRKRAERNLHRRPASSSSSPMGMTHYSLKYGAEDIQVRLDYPTPNDYVGQAAIMLLRQAYEVFQRNEVLDDLVIHLERRLQDVSDDDRVYALLAAGYVRWWTDEREDALELLQQASELLKDDPWFHLEVAILHQSLGNLDDALNTLDAITPRDQKLVQRRELMALQCAERLGDIERARQAAERLFGLRLDTNTQFSLVEPMRRLGMQEMAEAITSRLQRRAGSSLSSMATLMALYQSQGKTDLAEQIAHTILRGTTSALSSMSHAGRNPLRYASRSGDPALRKRALQLLHQTGALKDLIARVEDQIERSPNSPRLYGELVEYYEAANDRDKVNSLLAQAVEARPDALLLRYQLAKNLESSSKLAEACDQYLEILKQMPEWMSEDMHRVWRTFQRAERSTDFIKAMGTINLKSLRSPYFIVELVAEMMRQRRGEQNEKSRENLEVALDLCERVFDALPQYRSRLVSVMYQENLWENDRVFALGKQAVIPTAREVAAIPWFGVHEVNSFSAGGIVTNEFGRMIDSLQGSEKMGELRQVIEQHLRETPDWLGGQALLALIDLKEDRKEQAIERLQRLVGDEQVIATMPGETCRIIGQELEKFEDTRLLAVQLFEAALAKPNSMREVEYTPVARLVALYETLGRETDARNLLLKPPANTNNLGFPSGYDSYRKVRSSLWVGQQLLKLGFPIDALRIFRGLVGDVREMDSSMQSFGSSSEQFRSQVDQGLEEALAALNTINAGEAIIHLLSVPEKRSEAAPALDLMLAVPDVEELQKKSIESPLIDLLATISKDEAVADDILARLADLKEQYPGDYSVTIAESTYLLRRQDNQADAALRNLLETVGAEPLEEIKVGRRPNSRQRRQALAQVPLWLVARECLGTEERQEIGAVLAQRALDAARRQSGHQHAAAILFDWGGIALSRNDHAAAEARWSDLLDVVTQRPEQNKRTASPQTIAGPTGPADGVEAGARRTPPLTISQFRLTMAIALAAAENAMPELSRKAVRLSMIGGSPVADVTTMSGVGMGGMGMGGVITRMSAVGAPTPGRPAESEMTLAESLRKVIGNWEGDGYPPAETYASLLPIVFPDHRPTEILMYADSSQLQDARISSLGDVVVQHARRAGRLDDLSDRIKARAAYPPSRVPALVMQVRVALARDSMEDSRSALTELARLVREGTLPAMTELACHAALPATDYEALEEPAYTILTAALKAQFQSLDQATMRRSEGFSASKLFSMVSRYLARDPQEITRFFEDYLASRQAHFSQFSGDYGQYLQWSEWAAIADQAAKAGVTNVTMDFLGRVVDFSCESHRRPDTTAPLAALCRDMRRLPADQQFEAWRDWTLPNESRQTIRFVTAWIQPTRIPERFLETAAFPEHRYQDNVISNFTELLASARSQEQRADLLQRVKAAYENDQENASFLYALMLIESGDLQAGEAVVTRMIDTVVERLKRQPDRPVAESWGDYLVFRACMRSSQFAPLYRPKIRQFQQALRSMHDWMTLAQLPVEIALSADRDSPLSMRPGDAPQLTHWLPVTLQEDTSTSGDPWWTVQEGHLAYLTGGGADLLCFAYPVTGDFEFTVDAYFGDWAETDIGYDGVIVGAHRYGAGIVIWSTTGHESFGCGGIPEREREMFSSVTIKVADGKMQYLLNNHVCHEEEVGGTSPWITLQTDFARPSIFRNPRFSGTPTIPREVLLVNDNRMDGWNCSFTGGSQPRHRLMARKPQGENDSITYAQQMEPKEFDWRAQDGMLLGRAADNDAGGQSWIHYHRPLRDRESFSYDFYYVPGTSVAHPTIGRLALLLEAGGVVEHWITRINWDDTVYGLDERNRVVVEEARRGADQLPLKEGDWNHVVLTLAEGVVQVQLNDQLVYERLLEPEIDHRFGLYRRNNESLKVRAPKLTGLWPEEFTPDVRENLLASGRQYTPADRRTINEILTDRFCWPEAPAVVEEARRLEPLLAYEKLRAWVLPSPDHVAPRLCFKFVDLQDSGQEMLCPAGELVAVADTIGKLEELRAAIDSYEPTTTYQKRGKTALAALVAMQTGDFGTARELMTRLLDYFGEGMPQELRAQERAYELVVTWHAAKYPELRFAALDLMNRLREKERDAATAAEDHTWAIWVDVLAGHVQRNILGDAPIASSHRTLRQWSTVPLDKPQLRAAGYRHTDWLYVPGAVQHIPGGAWGQLFFQSPLQGNFEIVAQRSLHGHRETAIAYGMHCAEPRWDFKARRITTLMQGHRDMEGDVDLPRKDQWLADFRVVVQDNKVTTFVNDLQLHEETLAPRPAPWLVLQTASPGYAGTVRNLRILGEPEIPDEIDLVRADWAAWRVDIYGEKFSLDAADQEASWKKVGDEIRGEIRKSMAARNVESLMMYQRPMLEDGVIEFESYFVPGEFEVHPAVGRTALVVSPGGVHRHVLTDFPHDTGGLAPDNASPIDGAADHVELKENDWNRYRLTLRDDTLTLAVNDTEVATVVVTESANRRHFGLFRYGDKTQCRVRNLVYRGQWPKALPPVEEQQLAQPVNMEGLAEWGQPSVFDLRQSKEELLAAGVRLEGHQEAFVETDEGIRVSFSEASGQTARPKIRFPQPIEGDCMITVDFAHLHMLPAKTGWGSVFSLRAKLSTGYAEAGIGMNLEGETELRSTRGYNMPAGGNLVDVRRLAASVEGGRLRLLRTGSLLATYYANDGTDEFRLLEIHPVGDAHLEAVSIEWVASDSVATIDVVVTKLTLHQAVQAASGTGE